MRNVFLMLVVLLCCISCVADKADNTVEKDMKAANKAAGQAAIAAALQDPRQFEVHSKFSDESANAYQNFYRRDLLILSRHNPNVYVLCGPNGCGFGYVVVGKPNSPHFMFDNPDRHHVSVDLLMLPDGSMQLQALDLEASFMEVYTLTRESVQPVPAKDYLHFLAEFRASNAFFGSLGKSLQKAAPTTQP
jgi:hypothetical protein